MIGSGGATYAVDLWYNEGSQYNYSNPGFSPATGHFTQVVWVGSKQLGCAVGNCPNGVNVSGQNWQYPMYFCEYNPPGNVIGYFAQNVLAR